MRLLLRLHLGVVVRQCVFGPIVVTLGAVRKPVHLNVTGCSLLLHLLCLTFQLLLHQSSQVINYSSV